MLDNQTNLLGAFTEAASTFAKRAWAFVHHGNTSLEDVAYDYMMEVHRGQKFKYIEGSYAQHPIAVANQQVDSIRRSKGDLHDAIEEPVAKLMGALRLRENAGLARQIEESARQNEFKRMRHFFAGRGYDSTILEPDLNALTRYSWETRADSTTRLIKHAHNTGGDDAPAVKLGDAKHNRLARRNLPLEKQTPKVKRRLGEYDAEIDRIEGEFPHIRLHSIPEKDDQPESARGNPVSIRNLTRVFSLFM